MESLKAIFFLLVFSLFLTGCDELISDILAGDEELDKAAASGDPQKCLALDTSKDSARMQKCIGEMARIEKEKALCDLLEKGYYKDSCIEKVAVAKGDTKICAEMAESHEACIKNVAIKLKDRSYCGELTDEDLKNSCYMQVALAQGNTQYCRDIADADTRKNCLYEYATQRSAPIYCEETEDLRDSCVSIIALREGRTKECLVLSDGLYDCVYGVAEDKKDAGFCEAITSPGTREKCVHNLAVYTHDTAVCGNIKDLALKNQCIKSTGLTVMQ